MRRAIKSIIKKKKPLSAVYRTKLCYFLGEHKNVPLETFYCRSMPCSSPYLLLLLYFQHARENLKSFQVPSMLPQFFGRAPALFFWGFFFFRRSRRCDCVVTQKQDCECQNEPAFNSAVDLFWLRPCHPQGPHYRL